MAILIKKIFSEPYPFFPFRKQYQPIIISTKIEQENLKLKNFITLRMRHSFS